VRPIVAGLALLGIVGPLLGLTACESSHLYADSRLAATVTGDGRVEVMTWTCRSDDVQRLSATSGTKEIWSATPSGSGTEHGLVTVRADGAPQEGWTTTGAIDRASTAEVFLYVAVAGEGQQTLAVTPDALSPGEVTVAPHAYGASSVSEDDFIRTNERWCTASAERS
jgi:hypothetical protein